MEELRLKLKDELERSKTVVKEKVYLEKESRDKDFKVKELEDTAEEMQKKLDDLSNVNETLKVMIFLLFFKYVLDDLCECILNNPLQNNNSLNNIFFFL